MAVLPRDVVVLAPEQFDKLVELLTPGYELAKGYLEQSRPAEPAADDASNGEGNPMDQGTVPPANEFASDPPAHDDPSKQGSG